MPFDTVKISGSGLAALPAGSAIRCGELHIILIFGIRFILIGRKGISAVLAGTVQQNFRHIHISVLDHLLHRQQIISEQLFLLLPQILRDTYRHHFELEILKVCHRLRFASAAAAHPVHEIHPAKQTIIQACHFLFLPRKKSHGRLLYQTTICVDVNHSVIDIVPGNGKLLKCFPRPFFPKRGI